MQGNTGEYDPDSLLTGEEIAQGYTYSNSHRWYPSEEVKKEMVRGEYKISDIPMIAPRLFREDFVRGSALTVVDAHKENEEGV